MRMALDLAREAMEEGEVPVGCVIVWEDGRVVGRGRNRRETGKDALAHAELEAIRQANALLGGWRLHKATLYVTLEPCPMCAGGIINARIPQVWYGAADAKAGCCGSVLDLFAPALQPPPPRSTAAFWRRSAPRCSRLFSSVSGTSVRRRNPFRPPPMRRLPRLVRPLHKIQKDLKLL